MNFFDYIKEKLFPKGNSQPSNKPFLQEPLKRPASELEAFEAWKESRERMELSGFLKEQFRLHKEGQENKSMIRILKTMTSNGFMLRFPANISNKGFQHFFDLLREQVLEAGYYNYMSDRKLFNKKINDQEYVEVIERHYLKPSLKKQMRRDPSPPYSQEYGNIHIELHMKNNHPSHIKFLVNSYNDRKFNPPKPFEDLIDIITISN